MKQARLKMIVCLGLYNPIKSLRGSSGNELLNFREFPLIAAGLITEQRYVQPKGMLCYRLNNSEEALDFCSCNDLVSSV